jgi:hypothetical protein
VVNDTPGNTPTSKKHDYILINTEWKEIDHYIKAQGVDDAKRQQKEFEDTYFFKTTLYLKVE